MQRCTLGEKQIASEVEGRDHDSGERQERGAYRGIHKEYTTPSLLAGKAKGSDFHEFLQPQGMEDWSFTGQQLGCDKALNVSPDSWIEGGQTTHRRWTNNPESDDMEAEILVTLGDTQQGRLFTLLGTCH